MNLIISYLGACRIGAAVFIVFRCIYFNHTFVTTCRNMFSDMFFQQISSVCSQ